MGKTACLRSTSKEPPLRCGLGGVGLPRASVTARPSIGPLAGKPPSACWMSRTSSSFATWTALMYGLCSAISQQATAYCWRRYIFPLTMEGEHAGRPFRVELAQFLELLRCGPEHHGPRPAPFGNGVGVLDLGNDLPVGQDRRGALGIATEDRRGRPFRLAGGQVETSQRGAEVRPEVQ